MMGNIYSPQSYAANSQEPNANGTRISGARVVNVGQEHLGGFRADLASLLSLSPYRTNFPVPSIHEATTVKACVNLNKDSLQIVREGGTLYRIRFTYDAYCSCYVKVYFNAKESPVGSIQARNELPPVCVEKGFGVVFEQPAEHCFDASLASAEESDSGTFPVVITMQAIQGAEGTTNTMIQSQTTFSTLLHCADDSYAIKVIKQKLPHLGNTYNLHDIFGLDYSGERESEGSRECVVCLSEPRDTTILPCNHMCLCASCAELMRTQTNKCPICRAPVRRLLSIHLCAANSMTPESSAAQASLDTEEDRDEGGEKEDGLLRK
jgi:hypothetical protein